MFWIFNLIFLYFGYSFGHISNNWAIFFNLLVTLEGAVGASWRHMAHQGVTGQSGATRGTPGRHGVLHASRGILPHVVFWGVTGSSGRYAVLGALRGAWGVTGCLGASWGALRRHGGYKAAMEKEREWQGVIGCNRV